MFSNVSLCCLILGSPAIKCYSCIYRNVSGVVAGTDCKDGGVNSIDCPSLADYCAVSVDVMVYTYILIDKYNAYFKHI